ATLVQGHRAKLVVAGLVRGEGRALCGDRRALTDAVLPPAALETHALAGADDHRLPRSVERVRPRRLHPPDRRVVGADDVVAAIDLVEVVALAHAIAGRDDHPLAAFDHAGQVRLEFHQPYLVVVVDGPYPAVVVEQHRQVVQVALDHRVLPRPGRILRGEHVQAALVDIGEDVEAAIVVAQHRRPDALAVEVLALLQAVLG